MRRISWAKRRRSGPDARRDAFAAALIAACAAPAVAQPVLIPVAPPARHVLAPPVPAPLPPLPLRTPFVDPPSGPDERAAASTPLQSAIRAALGAFSASPLAVMGEANRARARDGLLAAYARHDDQPFWTGPGGLTPAARAAIGRVRAGEEDGLTLSALALPSLSWTPDGPADQADTDVQISKAVVAYAEQASGSRLTPRRLSPILDVAPDVADPARALVSVSAAPDADAALLAFNPPHEDYARLKDALARLRAVAGPGGGRPLRPAPASFQPGETDTPDPGSEVQAVLANMEMWRWAPRDLGATHVAINIPDFTLTFVRDGQVALKERVIVGKPETPTSVFSNRIQYVLLNPIWRVPDSIVIKEFLPKLAQDPDYLARHGFVARQVGDRLVVTQPPGEENALGHILFMFPNDHSIYLHDTPGRSLFAHDFRALSHGCIRLDRPFEFGALLLEGDPKLSRFSLERAIGGEERTLTLASPTPIHIQYFTRFVDDSWLLQRRADLYGVERIVADTLIRLRQD